MLWLGSPAAFHGEYLKPKWLRNTECLDMYTQISGYTPIVDEVRFAHQRPRETQRATTTTTMTIMSRYRGIGVYPDILVHLDIGVKLDIGVYPGVGVITVIWVFPDIGAYTDIGVLSGHTPI